MHMYNRRNPSPWRKQRHIYKMQFKMLKGTAIKECPNITETPRRVQV